MGGKSEKHTEAWDWERKRKQREVILRHKPWLKSTGPKTIEGKEKSSKNSVDHFKKLSMKAIDQIFKKQERLINLLKNENAMNAHIQEIEDELAGIKQLIKGTGTGQK